MYRQGAVERKNMILQKYGGDTPPLVTKAVATFCILYLYASHKGVPSVESLVECAPQSTHRAATAAFWRTFHHDGKICPGW
jgi:hypothetical protein